MSAILREIANGFAIHHPAVIVYAAVVGAAYVVGKVVVAAASMKERLH